MICPSAPPSNPKISGTNWLDRLRSSKGFPSADAVDLNHFISDQNRPSTAATDPPRFPSRCAVDESRCNRNGESLGHGKGEEVRDILCDLFAMGGGRGEGRAETSIRAASGKKTSRKQQNPKFWDPTGSSKKSSNGVSDDLRRRNNKSKNNINGLASSGDHSLNQHRKERDSKDPGGLGLEEVDEQDLDLKGYSKSEVTVIDSSIEDWKVELFVFRKRKSKSVWKVREKTSKSRNLVNARRKRKMSKPISDDDDNGDGVERRKKKKMIVSVSDSAPGNMVEKGDGKEDATVPFINQGQVQEGKFDPTLRGVGYLHGEASIKSSHWKSRCESSSVILVKPLSFDKSITRKSGKVASLNKGNVLH